MRAWVREHIVYTLQDSNPNPSPSPSPNPNPNPNPNTLQDKSDRASETLAKREGMCTNKANLQVALLRADGV